MMEFTIITFSFHINAVLYLVLSKCSRVFVENRIKRKNLYNGFLQEFQCPFIGNGITKEKYKIFITLRIFLLSFNLICEPGINNWLCFGKSNFQTLFKDTREGRKNLYDLLYKVQFTDIYAEIFCKLFLYF